MFAKIDVNGDDEAPLYAFLKESMARPSGKPEIKWNFAKFLVDRSGAVVKRYAPNTTPEEIAPDVAPYLG